MRAALGSLGTRALGTLAGLVALVPAARGSSTPHFLTVSNLLNVLEQTAINAIVAVGHDVRDHLGRHRSVGRLAAWRCPASCSAARCRRAAGRRSRIVAGACASAGVRRARTALLITWGRLPPFIATLGHDERRARRGAALHRRPPDLRVRRRRSGSLATGARRSACPRRSLITIVVYLRRALRAARTRFGRYVYAIGGNEEATRLSGVHVRFHKTLVYGVSGLASAVAAVLLTARLNSAQPIAGIMYELDAIAATVIGGTSLLGGEGTSGTLIGALIMGVLRNGLNLLGVSSFFQQVVIGVVIIVAVLVDIGR